MKNLTSSGKVPGPPELRFLTFYLTCSFFKVTTRGPVRTFPPWRKPEVQEPLKIVGRDVPTNHHPGFHHLNIVLPTPRFATMLSPKLRILGPYHPGKRNNVPGPSPGKWLAVILRTAPRRCLFFFSKRHITCPTEDFVRSPRFVLAPRPENGPLVKKFSIRSPPHKPAPQKDKFFSRTIWTFTWPGPV